MEITQLNPTATDYKKYFVIYNRLTQNPIKTEFPVLSNPRNCFLFDPANRSLFKYIYKGGKATYEQILGNTYYGSNDETDVNVNVPSLHGERFNDYATNLPLGVYSFSAGYNTVARNGFEAAFGHFNKSEANSKQLFSVGCGSSETERRNAITVYDDKTEVEGDLHVSGNIVSAEIETIKNQLALIMNGGAPGSEEVKNEINALKEMVIMQQQVIAELRNELANTTIVTIE